MKVIYFNPDLRMHVVDSGDGTHAIVLAGLDEFDNDSADNTDPVEVSLSRLLDAGHYIEVGVGAFTYIARRDGVTITHCQVLLFDGHAHTDRVLGQALDAVIAYNSL